MVTEFFRTLLSYFSENECRGLTLARRNCLTRVSAFLELTGNLLGAQGMLHHKTMTTTASFYKKKRRRLRWPHSQA
jgi:hypothetical protein